MIMQDHCSVILATSNKKERKGHWHGMSYNLWHSLPRCSAGDKANTENLGRWQCFDNQVTSDGRIKQVPPLLLVETIGHHQCWIWQSQRVSQTAVRPNPCSPTHQLQNISQSNLGLVWLPRGKKLLQQLPIPTMAAKPASFGKHMQRTNAKPLLGFLSGTKFWWLIT